MPSDNKNDISTNNEDIYNQNVPPAIILLISFLIVTLVIIFLM